MQITIEYMIMIPMMIMQIFLFPFAAAAIMGNWTDSNRTLQLNGIANTIGSSFNQLYLTLNHDSLGTGVVTSKVDVSLFVDGYSYSGNASLRTASGINSTKILDITLTISGTKISSQNSVVLGENVRWLNSSFISKSNVVINANKLPNGTIEFSFL